MSNKVICYLANIFLTVVCIAAMNASVMAQQQEIVILHTNDIHCGVKDNVGLAAVAQLKKDIYKQTPYVLLVDAGDAIQGAPLGQLTKGRTMVELMEQAGYDFAVPGNHEFDYGLQEFWQLQQQSDYGYYCANFIKLSSREMVLPAYKIFTFGDKRVALVGAATPASLTSSTPAYFQDGQGKYVYGFNESADGWRLYRSIQRAVNSARENGADYVILVGHLGVNGSYPVWSSIAVAQNTRGIDAVIDGHSHEQLENITVKNYLGRKVVIAQAGTKLQKVGKLTLAEDKSVASELIGVAMADKDVERSIDKKLAKLKTLLQEKIGSATFAMYSVDPQTGKRLVRRQECNLANFVADALRESLSVDIALVNGGGVRGNLPAGNITYGDLLQVLPFGNSCAVIEASGQQLLDALEMGARKYPQENGGFLHISGIVYTIDSSIPSSVELDEKGNFIRVCGARRVKNVLVNGEPLDVSRQYVVGGAAYTLLQGGDGMTMFKGARILEHNRMQDIEAVTAYLQYKMQGVVSEQYQNINGDGRIIIK